MKLEFIELDLEWPSELTVFDLKNYILTKLKEYGKPLRWAITSVYTLTEKKNQIISVEAVYITSEDNRKGINTLLN